MGVWGCVKVREVGGWGYRGGWAGRESLSWVEKYQKVNFASFQHIGSIFKLFKNWRDQSRWFSGPRLFKTSAFQ